MAPTLLWADPSISWILLPKSVCVAWALQTQKKPAVLYCFLLETLTYIRNNLSRIRIASCNLAGEQEVGSRSWVLPRGAHSCWPGAGQPPSAWLSGGPATS